MAWLMEPMSPNTAKHWYVGNHSKWAEEARKCADYLDHLRAQLEEGPPPIHPSFGIDSRAMTVVWYSNHHRRIAEVEQMVTDYAELLKEVG